MSSGLADFAAFSYPVCMEIIFEVREDEVDGGYVASALGHAIFTQGETLEELRTQVRDAVQCHFGDGHAGPFPKMIRLHIVRDELLAA
jgi:predicted RNase H-like HicB family nuclease